MKTLNVRAVTVRAQPATAAIANGIEQAQEATGILDGLVHDGDTGQTHQLDLGVRELVTDQTRDLGVGLAELPTISLGADVLGGTVKIAVDHALDDGDVVGDALGGTKVPMAEQLLGVVADVVALLLEVSDPLGASAAVGGDAEVDHAVLLAPGAGGFGNHEFVTQETFGTRDAAQLVENSLDKAELDVRVLHGGTHYKTLSLTTGQNCSLA